MSKHKEFPELTPEARAAYDAADHASAGARISHSDLRRALAAFLREAMKQADKRGFAWLELEAIAASLHNFPPPPPTLAEARKADLSTAEGRITVVTFLANLATETQP